MCLAHAAGMLGQGWPPNLLYAIGRAQSLMPAILSGACRCSAGVLYAAAGTDPYELLDRGVAAAARLSGASSSSSRMPAGKAMRRLLEMTYVAALPAADCWTTASLEHHSLLTKWRLSFNCHLPCRLLSASLGEASPRLAGCVWLVLLGRHVHGWVGARQTDVSTCPPVRACEEGVKEALIVSRRRLQETSNWHTCIPAHDSQA